MYSPRAVVTLEQLGQKSPHSPYTRKFTLSSANPFMMIGRFSKREQKNRRPGPENGWYDSRVMSRDHAEFTFQAETKTLSIVDMGSTHGTWLNNNRLFYGDNARLQSGDILRFGVHVENGEDRFPAVIVRLTIELSVDWSDEENCSEVEIDHVDKLQPAANLPTLRPVSSTNTFQVPESDSDIEEVPIEETRWARQSFEKSPVAEATSSHLPTPISSETSELKEPCQTGHAGPVKLIINNEHIGPAPKNVFYPQNSNPEPPVDGDDKAEFDRELSASYDDVDSDELDNYNDHESTRNLLESDLELDSDVEYDSQDDDQSEEISSISQASSEDDSSSVDKKSEAEFINPLILAGRNNPVLGGSFWDSLNACQEIPSVPTIAAPKTPDLHKSDSLTRCTIPALLNCSPPLPMNVGDALKAHGPVEEIPSLQYPQPSSPCYHDGPFASFESDINGTKSERATPFSRLPMKRKASEMELPDTEIPSTSDLPSQEATIHQVEQDQAATAIGSALAEAERPSKRVKSSHPSSNLASYTATAVISAVLGGLGTIVLLAALPAEYFQ